ncbi:MAG TPA: hypothetical protein VF659_23335 [Pyrinomonadaceae bacterium]|jgi:hypothetical protein
MTWTEWVALIGAAAWLPQIGQWIYALAAKPKLKVLPAPTVSIGYNILGPIVNLMVSISAERRDAVVEKITLKIRHEKGEERQLTWKVLDETFSQVRTHTGESAEYIKNQPAIALKVSTLLLVEKTIGFQDFEFQAKSQELTGRLEEEYEFLKKRHQSEDVINQILQTKDYTKARDFFNDYYYWREGRYTFQMQLHEVRRRKPHIEKFEVILSKADVELLRENCKYLEDYVRAQILSEGNKETKFPSWNWSSPQIKRIVA